MDKSKFTQFFCTTKLEQLFKGERLIRVDKDQSTVVFNDIPAFIIDALQCIHKDYFFTKFQSVVPTVTDDYQSCLILIPKE
jgi:hypothetical protein